MKRFFYKLFGIRYVEILGCNDIEIIRAYSFNGDEYCFYDEKIFIVDREKAFISQVDKMTRKKDSLYNNKPYSIKIKEGEK